MNGAEDDFGVPIHAALTRPELVMGCDRTLLGLTFMSTSIPIMLGIQQLRIDLVLSGALVLALSVSILLRAGKQDPQLPAVWLRARRYPKKLVAVGRVDRRPRLRRQ